MAAPFGNDYGLAIKDPETRQEAYRAYCQHIAEGYPKEAFSFRHPKEPCCWRTIDRYAKENPQEFHPLLMEDAKAQRYKLWFSEGKALMRGAYKNGSPVVWQTIMRNVFKDVGWDQLDVQERGQEQVQQFKIMMDTLSQRQGVIARNALHQIAQSPTAQTLEETPPSHS
jgi:hypothetical protein